jgi:hypothetical protein
MTFVVVATTSFVVATTFSVIATTSIVVAATSLVVAATRRGVRATALARVLLKLVMRGAKAAWKETNMTNPVPTESRNPASLEAKLDLMVEGMETVLLPGTTTLRVDQKDVPVADIVTELKGYSSQCKAVDDARQGVAVALQTRRTIQPKARARLAVLKDALFVALGRMNPKLAKFGVKPAKERAPLTTDKKVIASAKAKATRAARGTTSKKQKQQIHGAPVESVTVDKSGKTTAKTSGDASNGTNGTTAANGTSANGGAAAKS